MDKIQEFIEILSDKHIENRTNYAKSSQTCKICGMPADKFLSASSEFEYAVSTICEECQVYYYGL
jgi:CRISPR/Cas system-associated protein Cas10 (large subunit of type III CRISPR-Cas system)